MVFHFQTSYAGSTESRIVALGSGGQHRDNHGFVHHHYINGTDIRAKTQL